jgi:amidase
MSSHNDSLGVWVPHGKFTMPATAQGELSGLSFAVKDVFDIAGHPTGAGNPTWLATHPTAIHTNPLVEQLRAEGAVVAGKVITDELAYSLNGDNVHYGTPVNVNAPGRVPGGSSSGSVAAVAGKLCDFALGTDTGGSTRVPASYCGVWGLRTTHGLLSAEHVVPLHPSFDTMTWFAHDATTFERVGDVLLPPYPFTAQKLFSSKALTALAQIDFIEPLNAVVTKLSEILGVHVQELELLEPGGNFEEWRQAYATMGASEAWAIHGQWITQHQPKFSAAILGRWHLASRLTPGEIESAVATVGQVRAHVRSLLAENAIMVIPSAASVAPVIGASGSEVDAIRMRTMQITCVAGIAGLCQVSIPFKNKQGLPVGVSLVGPVGCDAEIIRLATQVYRALL